MKRFLLVAAVIGGAAVVYARGCTLTSRSAPDVRLGNHFASACEIARDNIKTPVAGVRALGGYLDKNFGDMNAAWGETIVTIERVKDDTEHDERAREARGNIFGPLHECAEDWQKFGEAVSEDEQASSLVQERMERVSRSLEIILQARTNGIYDLRDIPAALEHSMFTE